MGRRGGRFWPADAGGAIVVNPGSVGQPRDGDPRASYTVIDAEKSSIELYRVKYDVDKIIGKLRALGISSPHIMEPQTAGETRYSRAPTPPEAASMEPA
ncbi:hypothetical protein APE_1275b [Aeropyrum pernix K1]|uniref:Uncharacterized protein n=1 Tax=Aeropyrum pernix (strain ATCC 700893 / DSM 11879 / JCM 9820 / NBRC 100138 / K1) TaxID=272557 RepID=Q9YCI1_AERPE|nr:hypothetical protein APE_1275b [Aeropyrum pernix K1]